MSIRDDMADPDSQFYKTYTPLKSKDPRKAIVLKALKAVSGATKVTQVFQINGKDEFCGECFKYLGNKQWTLLGNFTITIHRDYQ